MLLCVNANRKRRQGVNEHMKRDDEREAFLETLTYILTETFRDILRLEERMVQKIGQMNMSASELHLLDAVGKNGNGFKTISEVADILEITLPSVTNMVKRLSERGYIEKSKLNYDGRCVYVRLTVLGKRVNAVHKHFHRQMVTEVAKDLDDREKEILKKSLTKLDNFFKKSLT